MSIRFEFNSLDLTNMTKGIWEDPNPVYQALHLVYKQRVILNLANIHRPWIPHWLNKANKSIYINFYTSFYHYLHAFNAKTFIFLGRTRWFYWFLLGDFASCTKFQIKMIRQSINSARNPAAEQIKTRELKRSIQLHLQELTATHGANVYWMPQALTSRAVATPILRTKSASLYHILALQFRTSSDTNK